MIYEPHQCLQIRYATFPTLKEWKICKETQRNKLPKLQLHVYDFLIEALFHCMSEIKDEREKALRLRHLKLSITQLN
ncbi:CLUMA_CG021628, isoform A [Clunio marinus]|uniref:CLUMA_CG021628, isoform A n=1 Tax=Clunio marinus TaxID=568069 RepID=A0A1J1J9X2_9DIPT|nr:CLUMA_CG021628, isoform A [Clunio marinus]